LADLASVDPLAAHAEADHAMVYEHNAELVKRSLEIIRHHKAFRERGLHIQAIQKERNSLRSRLQESVDEVRVLSTQVVDVEDQRDRLRSRLQEAEAERDIEIATRVRVRRERDDFRSRLQEAEAALQSLTPGGSEFVNDPWRCVKFARDARDIEHAALMKKHARLQEAEAERDKARAACNTYHEELNKWVGKTMAAEAVVEEVREALPFMAGRCVDHPATLNHQCAWTHRRSLIALLSAYDSTLGGETE
jgi:uncharacterized coiled-coil DUF342 family protein